MLELRPDKQRLIRFQPALGTISNAPQGFNKSTSVLFTLFPGDPLAGSLAAYTEPSQANRDKSQDHTSRLEDTQGYSISLTECGPAGRPSLP